MESYCEGCDYSGAETYIGSMTLEECQAACVADASCMAIDHAIGGTNCYHNYATVPASSASNGYSAWIKTCGVADCNGVIDGGAVADECGVCDGDNTSCADCMGTPNGSASYDDCGVCDGDNSSCADCNGTPNGSASLDACGVCDGDNSSCADCNGTPNGSASLDDCGVCGGDGSSCACKSPAACKGADEQECTANPSCETKYKKGVFKKCKPIKNLMCKNQDTAEACNALCHCQAKMSKNGDFKKCKDI